MWRKKAVKEFADQAAERLIDMLKKGTAPWQKGWDTPSEANQPPYNPVSGTRYRGLNSLVLRMEAQERGYTDPRWMTYPHAKKIGAHVRKGEHGTRVEFWAPVRPKPAEAGKDNELAPDESTTRYALVRTYHVFNGEQIENLPPLDHDRPQQWEVSERAERLLQASGANIVHVHGNRAFYHPEHDQITMPKQEQFRTDEAYYSTALHELGHWTGHSERLDRETLREAGNPYTGGYGSEAYAKEELRAEMTSMTVNGALRLPHDPERHASYVGGWIKALENNPDEIRHAARDAGAAADYILQYDRERPREATDASRQAESAAPVPERQREAPTEPEMQPERTRDLSPSR